VGKKWGSDIGKKNPSAWVGGRTLLQLPRKNPQINLKKQLKENNGKTSVGDKGWS